MKIFAWKVSLNRLPTRLNLVRRGVLVSPISCPICLAGLEDLDHLLFICNLAAKVLRAVFKWWNLAWSPLDSYATWLSWFSSIRMLSQLKSVLEGKLQLQFFGYLEEQDHFHFSLCGGTETEDKTLARASVQLEIKFEGDNTPIVIQPPCYSASKRLLVKNFSSLISITLSTKTLPVFLLAQDQELRSTKDFEAKYNKVKAKLALLSSSASASKAATVKNKGLITEAYEWDEEEVSSDDNEMVEVKVLMALAEENDAISKEGARNGEWVKISMRKVHTLLEMEDNDDRKTYLDYLCIDLNYVEEQRNNLLSKHRDLVHELNACKEQLLVLKQAKLDFLTMQHVNTKILKENKNLRTELKELTTITETWLNSSNKVNQSDDIKVSIPGAERPWLEVPQTLEYRGGQLNAAPVLELPKKWLRFCQSLRNTNHVKDYELASLFGKLKYEGNLIDSIYETEKNKSLVSATPLSTAFFSTSIVQDFQNSPDDEEDTRSSHEYLNDLEEEYQARALLAKSKRFFKKGPSYQSPFQPKPLSSSQHKPELRPTKNFKAKCNKVKAKIALLSSSASASKASIVKNKGLIAEAYEWDEEEVSSYDNEMVEVKVLMALAEDNDAVSKEGVRNDPSSSEQKDLVFVKSSADDTSVCIPGVERPWLSEVEGFILPNHDTGRILPAESQRNTNYPLVAVTDCSTTDYDSADESLICSTPLPPLKKLNGAEHVSGPKTIKTILRSKSTFKDEKLKCVIINEPSSAPYVEQPRPKVVFGDDSTCTTEGFGYIKCNGIVFTKFDEKRGTIFNSNKEVVMIAPRVRDVYVLNMTSSAQESCFFAKASDILNWLWHKRLAHLNFKTINKLAKQNLVIGLPLIVYSKDKPCSSCGKGKHHRASFKTKHTSSIKKCLHLLHMGLFGPLTPRSINYEKYTLVIVDEYSRYTWVYFLKKKSQAPETIMSFIKRVENQNDIKVKQLRNDNGTEFRNSILVNFCDEKRISQNFSSPYTSEQNVVAERKNRTLIEAARTMLSGSIFSKQYWTEAVATACYTQNRSTIFTSIIIKIT
ncbi:retrovirus-related pol polyprotein from transposon TNT 1-94 [Tanacetum coccineum]